MKIHPALFGVLVLCALAGAFAVGRLGQTPPASVPASPSAGAVSVSSQIVPTIPVQSAEIKTAKETLRVEGSATILSVPPAATKNP